MALTICAGLVAVTNTACASGPAGHLPGRSVAAIAGVEPARATGYRVPRGALRVSTSSELRGALRRHDRQDIVLASGVYGGRRPFLDPHAHRLYAAHPGRAILRAGLSLGGNTGRGGAVVRGLVVDVADRSRTVDGAAIAVWGVGRDTQILDTRVEGHGTLPAGISARRPEGLVIRRVRASGFTDYGVLADANEPTSSTPADRFTITDLDVRHVARVPRGSSNGRAEACLWIGNPGDVARVRVRDCGWSGVWTGTATDGAHLSDVDVDDAPTGVYIEHFTTNSLFEGLRIGAGVRVGVLAEWDDPAWGGRPASVDNTIRASRIHSRLVGVYLDDGTTRTVVADSSFAGQSWAAIGDFRGQDNRETGNDFAAIDAGARQVRHDHLGTARDGGP
ncbi:hypothetical protein [Capillimicrobium parvum]|uniref:Right-handed parallel beta-helix repeat-containing protein n=1 Tax=Capillimicrobium parvum TaxID=2884022 RepID=A0A9E6XV58_9ACTN|nr:hypothetical protein [Capillimicrobium parvum]UGS34991.1 hypothetical protein DSM104329_01375 [Capillimicrobium parvum]